MISFIPAGRVRFFLACILMLCLYPLQARSMTYYWGRHPQKERVVFVFSSPVPSFTVKRSGPKSISLILPKKFWQKETLPAAVDLRISRLIRQVIPDSDGMRIDLRTPAFGFIYFPLPTENKIVVDIFRDPLGAQWTDPAMHKETTPPLPAEKTTPAVDGKPQPKPQASPELKPSPAPTAVLQTDPAPALPSVKKTAYKTKRYPINRTMKESEPADEADAETETDAEKTVTTPSLSDTAQNSTATPEEISPQAPVPHTTPGSFRFKVKHQNAEQAFAMDSSDKATDTPEEQSPPQPSLNLPDPKEENPATKEPPPNVTQNVPAAASPAEKPSVPDNSTLDTTTANLPETEESNTTNATATPNFDANLTMAKAALRNGQLDAALEIFQGMVNHPKFPDPLHEETLYLIAETLFQKYHNEIKEHFQEVMSAFQTAINFNPRSLRMSSALLSMGVVNLKAGNLPEAKAYFNLIRKKYPDDSNTPLTYFYMGEHYLQDKDYQRAADNFQYVVQQYPDSTMVQGSAVGLTKALKELGFYPQAFQIMDYVEKRWPRYYIEDPEFLMLAGYIKFKSDKLEQAKESFWTYVNLTPEAKNVDIALARIGDIYVMTDKKKAAREVYEKTAAMYPGEEGGLIAKMRLAEEGVFDKPSLKKMFSVFDRPYSLRPKEVYTQIIEKYPNSPLAPVAHLKLAMWLLWSNKLSETVETVAEFAKKFPDQELLPKAFEVGRKAFSQWLPKAIAAERYKEIISTWNKHPFLHQDIDAMTRLAVATAFWKTGADDQALVMAEPFLNGPLPVGSSSGPALDLVLAILVKSQSWQKILDITKNVNAWDLSDIRQRQFEYTRALAYENLGKTEKSHPLWIKLASDIELSDSQRAYALYFLARHAEQSKDLKNEYLMAQQALSLFLSMPQRDLPKIRECLNMLTQVTARTRRVQEALGWGIEFEKYIPKDDPSWPAHMYTLANLYKLNQDIPMWQKKLGAIIKEYPGSIYSKMAATDLESAKLQKELRPFE